MAFVRTLVHKGNIIFYTKPPCIFVSFNAVILKGGPWTKNISIPLEIIRNVNTWISLQSELNQSLLEPSDLQCNKPSG